MFESLYFFILKDLFGVRINWNFKYELFILKDESNNNIWPNYISKTLSIEVNLSRFGSTVFTWSDKILEWRFPMSNVVVGLKNT